MSNRPLRQSDLAFFGATTASVSHELKNVITIINESAGLLQDFALAAERGKPLDPQRVKKTSLDIGRNVGRAVEIINRLNRFAHSVDEPFRALDVSRLVLDVAALSVRMAGLGGRQINAVVPEAAMTVTTYPFALHQILLQAIRIGAAAQPSPAPITVTLAKAAGGATIRIEPSPDAWSGGQQALWSDILATCEEIGGSAAHLDAPGGLHAMEIRVPERPAGAGQAESS
ncbi:MAG: hypothetical protein MUF54_22020 [Polyangiaceae bacterium]|nr:hypothetical protein [Polyangiaceae bacterium]